MDQKAVLKRLSDGGPFVIVNGRVRLKDHPFTPFKASLMDVLATGRVEIRNNHIYVMPFRDERSRSANYSQRMRDRGCVRKSLWVHPDDVERFDEFTMTLKGPSDD